MPPDDRMLICRATIATVMGRPINIISATQRGNEIVRTHYRRPVDGSTWLNACRLDGDRVVWAWVRGDRSIGRWRDDRRDSVITYRLSPRQVTIEESFGDGSSITERFPRVQRGQSKER